MRLLVHFQTDDYMHKILDTLEESTFEKGDIVLDPSIDAEHFYFVLEGEILVIQTDGRFGALADSTIHPVNVPHRCPGEAHYPTQ